MWSSLLGTRGHIFVFAWCICSLFIPQFIHFSLVAAGFWVLDKYHLSETALEFNLSISPFDWDNFPRIIFLGILLRFPLIFDPVNRERCLLRLLNELVLRTQGVLMLNAWWIRSLMESCLLDWFQGNLWNWFF